MALKKLPLHSAHVALKAQFTPFAGFEMPLRYIGEKTEHIGCRTQVALFDVSHMAQFLFEGTKAANLIQFLSCNDITLLKPGKAQYNCLLTPFATIVDDFILYQLDEHKYLGVFNAANHEKDWYYIQHYNQEKAVIKDVSEDFVLLALSGPAAPNLMKELTDESVAEMPYYAIRTDVSLAGVKVWVASTGYTGERTYEIFVSPEHAQKVWEVLMDEGQTYSIDAAGLAARDTLRIEMGYPLYGNDISEATTPLESNLTWLVKWEKDFIGKPFLQKQKAQGVPKVFVGINTLERGIPRKDMLILNEKDEIIGVITSGTFSPILNNGIGLGYVLPEYAKEKTVVYVQMRNRKVKSEVVKPPFVKNTSLLRWRMQRKKSA